jgi:hypothetical protein
VFTVPATRTLLRRIGEIDGPDSAPGQRSTSALGDWYATTLPWRPQVALFVNETTLLPILPPSPRPRPSPAGSPRQRT